MSDMNQDQIRALDIAHTLVDMGAPIFTAFPNSSNGDFLYPADWQHKQPSHAAVDAWKPGKALCMVTGVVFDVIDEDPRNGGNLDELFSQIQIPTCYGRAATPSAGTHLFIARTHLAKGKPARGIDLQAGADDGTGRGFVFIAPTVRISKYGPNEGKPVAYQWLQEPTLPTVDDDDPGYRAFIDLCQAGKRTPRVVGATPAGTPRDDADGFFDEANEEWTTEAAWTLIAEQRNAVATALIGEINGTLGGAARVLGRFVAGGLLTEDEAATMLLEDAETNPYHSDRWNTANGLDWTAATCIGAGLARGQEEPWVVVRPATTERADTLKPEPGTLQPGPAAAGTVPNLEIIGAAEMAYWLQSVLGSGTLSGFFLRGGQVVHTPRVDELGYVEPRGDGGDNGPAQVQAVTPGTLAAKIQYAHRCYKMVDVKDEAGKRTGEKREALALFPLEAARRAVDAPEAMAMLRALRGITLTPMVRADGTVLDRPGYDAASGYLYLPDAGLKIKNLEVAPTREDVREAVALLDEMTAGFPWQSQDDRANYYGLLLTPLLRLLTPPTYKLFGITAHQPGSGKTMLADLVRTIHGGVFRTEFPLEEYDIRQMVTAILATTSAPVVHVDNVKGVLKSSVLAGYLTSDGDIQERELGKSSNLTFRNDRTWVVTGNNLSLGGDLVRRVVVIDIDPNMANPETRSFAINDLKGWVADHRGELLAALITMIRYWVGQGSHPLKRSQSDSYARWEGVVAGVLAAAGVPGAFDSASGQRAAAGGDDDGLADILSRLYEAHDVEKWTVSDALSSTHSADEGEWVQASREWLPGPVLDKLARSEAAGRKTFGYWLRNRVGRWVTGDDGHSYVLRKEGKDRNGQGWRVERSS